MRKLMGFIVLIVYVLIPNAVFADPIKVEVNGKPLNFDAQPQIIDGRSMVPLRAIFESLGAKVSWNESDQTVTGQKGDTFVKLAIGSKEAKVNNEVVQLDVPPSIIEESAFVPLRFVAESMGAKVDWNSASQSISIKDFLPPLAPINSDHDKTLFWDKNAGSIDKRFESAKNSTPELIAFIRQMPKGADLHNHVSGATYSDYLLDSAEKNGLSYDLGTNLFFSPSDTKYKPVNPISINQLKSNSVYLAQFLNTYSMRVWYPNTTNGHDQFFNTFNYMYSAARSNDDMLVEVAKRNIYEKVKYLELMIGSVPNEYINLFGSTAQDFNMDNLDKAYDEAMNAVKNADFDVNASIHNFLDAREKKLTDNGISLGPNKDIVIRYVQQLKRSTNDMRSFFLSAFYSVYAANIDNRIAGVNIVQAEDTPYSRSYYDDEMVIMDYIWNKMNKPSFTIHAGELVLRESPVEPMEDRISTTIKKGHALRIGHGVSIAWEKNVPEILKYMRDNNILVEICLSSNESILGVKDKAHPFIMYRKAGVKTALSTDDEGVSRGNLTEEYVKAVERYDLSYDDLKELSRNSLEYSFLGGQSLYVDGDYGKIRREFEGIRDIDYKITPEGQKLLEENPKMEREYVLERAYVVYEDKLSKGIIED